MADGLRFSLAGAMRPCKRFDARHHAPLLFDASAYEVVALLALFREGSFCVKYLQGKLRAYAPSAPAASSTARPVASTHSQSSHSANSGRSGGSGSRHGSGPATAGPHRSQRQQLSPHTQPPPEQKQQRGRRPSFYARRQVSYPHCGCVGPLRASMSSYTLTVISETYVSHAEMQTAWCIRDPNPRNSPHPDQRTGRYNRRPSRQTPHQETFLLLGIHSLLFLRFPTHRKCLAKIFSLWHSVRPLLFAHCSSSSSSSSSNDNHHARRTQFVTRYPLVGQGFHRRRGSLPIPSRSLQNSIEPSNKRRRIKLEKQRAKKSKQKKIVMKRWPGAATIAAAFHLFRMPTNYVGNLFFEC